MHVRDVMTKNPVCCLPDATLKDAARIMVERDCGSIPVVSDAVERRPIGIVTDRDIVTRTLAIGRDPVALQVRDCMTSPVVTIVEDANLGDCVELLERGQIRRVIVVDDAGRCTGIVAQADIAQHASKRETGDLVQEVSRPSTPAFMS